MISDSVQHGQAQAWKPRFFAIWSGQAISMVGSAMSQFVLVWWITDTTGSASALATGSLMALLPQAIFGPLGGTLADRWSGRRMMIVSDLITALCMAALILLFATGRVLLWHVYTLMFVRSMMHAFQRPAAAASTSMLVPKDWLMRVSSMNQTLEGALTITAAPLGALALGILPFYGALMIDIVTALLGVLPLLFHRIPQPARADIAQTGVWQDFRQGLRLLSNNRGLLWLYTLMTLINALLVPAFALVPLLVRNEFGGGVRHVAWMEGLGGVGMVLAGLLMSVIKLPHRRIIVVLTWYTAACVMVALTGMAPGSMFWLAVVWWVLCYATYTNGNAPIFAILQTIVPNEMQGRALSLFSTLMGVAGPVGLALAAPLGVVIGTRGLLIGGGILSAMVCSIGFLSPSLRQIEEQSLKKELNEREYG